MATATRASTVVAAGAVLAVAVALAGCGGSSSSSSSTSSSAPASTQSTTSTSPSGVNYSPSQKVLDTLGLKQCSRENIPSTLFVNPNSSAGTGSFAGGAIFTAAPDCSKGPKTTIIAATFTTHEGIAAGKAAIVKKYPKAGVSSFRTVVIGVVGGTNPQQTADKITKELSAGTTSG